MTGWKRLARRGFNRFGYDLVQATSPTTPTAAELPASDGLPASGDPFPIPPDLDEDDIALIRRVQPYTLTTPERIIALRDAVRYVVGIGVPGAFAECGVWRGGSVMTMTITLVELGVFDRDLYLYDTFTAMPPPGDEDVDLWGVSQKELVARAEQTGEVDPTYAFLPFEEVRRVVEATGYPPERLHWVAGMVEETIPAETPDELALLRLDTDWYASTRHELEHLYPRLRERGVLIIDDYGHYRGARKAVDEYLDQLGQPVLLHRLDYAARLLVKQ